MSSLGKQEEFGKEDWLPSRFKDRAFWWWRRVMESSVLILNKPVPVPSLL